LELFLAFLHLVQFLILLIHLLLEQNQDPFFVILEFVLERHSLLQVVLQLLVLTEEDLHFHLLLVAELDFFIFDGVEPFEVHGVFAFDFFDVADGTEAIVEALELLAHDVLGDLGEPELLLHLVVVVREVLADLLLLQALLPDLVSGSFID